MKKIRIAIQRNGRLTNGSIECLRALGLRFGVDTKRLICACSNYNAEIVLLRDDDIPEFIAAGLVDFGIVGRNIILESGQKFQLIDSLGFGRCSLVLAAPGSAGINKLSDFNGQTIATSYPRILGEYLKKKDIQARIVVMSGSVEAAPALGLSDAVCDITETGSSLRANNLRVIDTVLSSEAVLIGGQPSLLKKVNLLNLCELLTVEKLASQVY